ncbi:hypothetical protein IHE45_01G052700 [Dioscorea alata]|uniref:Uncharacterized protein n=1 Tax=Dioscorea alata TaxID=55571 RepID=A0ACB7WUI4_DIOAL|nr:hypothetical protein IHE45_01G052700 [Dioscorea alata]
MVTRFKRYLSLPVTRPPKRRPVPLQKRHHVRSTSLPCPSHPLISDLEAEIRALRAWLPRSGPNRFGSVRSGLDRLERVLSSLADLLRLPQSQESVRRSKGSVWTERLLEDSVRLADGFGSLRSEIMAVRDHQWEAQTAIRRRDEARLAASAKAMRCCEKELVRIASAMKSAARSPGTRSEEEMNWVVRDAISAMVEASESAVLGIAGAVAGKKREMDDEELEKMEAVQSGSEMVFRRLVDIRVLILNALTPCL